MAELPEATTFPRGFPALPNISWPLVPARDLFELRYGKALVETRRRPGSVVVFGSNGPCGSHDEPLFKGPGVILGRKGQGPLGVKWSNEDYWVIDTAYTLKPLTALIDLRFSYYLIGLIGLNHLKDGTSNPTLSREVFGSQAFPVPPIADQARIASVLTSLDDKVALNNCMNETLEGVARAIFKDWFVDFGPTRAKSEGRDPYLAPEIWALFPDGLDDEGRPDGWRPSTVGAEFRLTMGQSPPGDTYNEAADGLPFFQGRTDFGFRYPERRMFCNAPTRVAEPDDTLVSVRAPVGDLNMAWEKCCIGRGVAAVRHQSGHRGYTYCAMSYLQSDLAAFEHTGTVFGAINKSQFEALKITAPDKKIIDVFENIVAEFDERIRANEAESTIVVATRDLLLPKLMSGEVRARDAEKITEAAL